jgi:hypothetical protein
MGILSNWLSHVAVNFPQTPRMAGWLENERNIAEVAGDGDISSPELPTLVSQTPSDMSILNITVEEVAFPDAHDREKKDVVLPLIEGNAREAIWIASMKSAAIHD